MSAALATPITRQPSPSLYAIEERLEMLFASEDFIDPNAPDAEHLRAMLSQEIAQTLSAELAKVDGIAGYLAFLENQQAFADAEITRLKLRKARFEKRQERIEKNVIALLQAQRRPRLEGNTAFLALRACPASLEVLDEDAVPSEYKTTTITSTTTVNKNQIKGILKAKLDVPGVRLVTDRQRLVHG